MIWLFPACLLTALAYATVGLAGGSTYLALMALAGMESDAMRATALALNLVVAAGGTWHFHRAGHFRAKLLVPFAVTSIPAAFLAGLTPLSDRIFFGLLSVAMMLVAARMVFWREPRGKPREISWRLAWRWGPAVGAGLGALAGLVGIGGGIFLGPVLILLGWADGKKAAAVSSAFILVNSVAGLAAHLARGNVPAGADIAPLALAVLIGGQIGARWGALQLTPRRLEQAFGVMVFTVAMRIGWGVW